MEMFLEFFALIIFLLIMIADDEKILNCRR